MRVISHQQQVTCDNSDTLHANTNFTIEYKKRSRELHVESNSFVDPLSNRIFLPHSCYIARLCKLSNLAKKIINTNIVRQTTCVNIFVKLNYCNRELINNPITVYH